MTPFLQRDEKKLQPRRLQDNFDAGTFTNGTVPEPLH